MGLVVFLEQYFGESIAIRAQPFALFVCEGLKNFGDGVDEVRACEEELVVRGDVYDLMKRV